MEQGSISLNLPSRAPWRLFDSFDAYISIDSEVKSVVLLWLIRVFLRFWVKERVGWGWVRGGFCGFFEMGIGGLEGGGEIWFNFILALVRTDLMFSIVAWRVSYSCLARIDLLCKEILFKILEAFS